VQAPSLIAEFIGHPREYAWDRAYADAKSLVETARAVSILDASDGGFGPVADQDAQVAVLFHALRASEAGQKRARERLEQVCKRQEIDGILALGLAPVGKNSQDAAEVVYTQVGDPPLGLRRWIEGADDVKQLRGLLTDWLLTLIDLCIPSTSSPTGSEAVLSAEMPATSAGTAPSRPRRLRGAI
jgi:hypothetical protein